MTTNICRECGEDMIWGYCARCKVETTNKATRHSEYLYKQKVFIEQSVPAHREVMEEYWDELV